jgi:hypothetical protein
LGAAHFPIKPHNQYHMPKRKFQPPSVCPVCGEDVPPRALACPECGADEESGWKEDAEVSDGVDLPDEEFDYDEFVAKEFGGAKRKSGSQRFWWIVGVLVLAGLLIARFFF